MKLNLKIAAMLSFLFLGAISLSAQEANFTLTVKMARPMQGYTAFLEYKTGVDGKGLDSVAYADGKFEIKGKTLHPQRAYIYVAPSNKGFSVYSITLFRIPVYLEGGHILISAGNELKGAKLSGTPLNDVYQGHTDVVDAFNPRLNVLKEKYVKAVQQHDTATIDKVMPGFRALRKETEKAEENYFLAHLDSPVSLDWLKQAVSMVKEKSRAAALFAKMSDKVKNSASGKEYSKSLNNTLAVEVGSPAPVFSAENIKGEVISLSAFRGKYVLLDFWASWCGPCRQENPNVLKAYNAYKSKNFTVIGFSMDSSKMAWENAVAQDGLPWLQLAGFAKKDGQLPPLLYGVTAIPSNFLIDPQGKIIAMNLRGEELENTLAKVLKAPSK